METKEQILAQVLPQGVLEPLTLEARSALPQCLRSITYVMIHKLPFRIGRESRVRPTKGGLERVERPSLADDCASNNDLYLVDSGEKLNISREHLQIELRDGNYVVADRGSACGTHVGDSAIGGDGQLGVSHLCDGDTITIGTKTSPYQYRFFNFDGLKVVKKKTE